MEIMITAGCVALGGALGALLRTGLGDLLVWATGQGPLGTLAANLIGCALMGAGKAAIHHVDWGSPRTRALLFSGFLGAFTTFSTFEADTAALWRDGHAALAVGYVLISVLGGLAAFALGWWITQRALLAP